MAQDGATLLPPVRAGFPPTVIQLSAICKTYGIQPALTEVSLGLRPGRIHALLGENGAGKSTLMQILYGLVRPDLGHITVGGNRVEIRSPRDAMALGIGMVHQHFTLVPTLSVRDTCILSAGRTLGRIDHSLWERRIAELAQRMQWRLDLAAPVGSLSVGEQQRVEIIKALLAARRDGIAAPARCLILDEPTAVLAPQAVDELLAALRRLAEDGTGVVFISHKLAEVERLADEVTVLRRGRVVHHGAAGELDRAALAQLMLGEGWEERLPDVPRRLTPQDPTPLPELPPELAGQVPEPSEWTPLVSGTGSHRIRKPRRESTGVGGPGVVTPGHRAGEIPVPLRPDHRIPLGEERLRVSGATLPGAGDKLRLNDISFAVRGGEIVGLAGVDGNGQGPLVRAILGLEPELRGRIDTPGLRPAERLTRNGTGLGLIPDDRQHEGLVLELTVADNLLLNDRRRDGIARWKDLPGGGWISRAAWRQRARDLIGRFAIQPANPKVAVASLSGGNQQKVVVARELHREPGLIIAVNPTRGLDPGAARDVLERLKAARRRGAGILLIHHDLDELLELADRVLVCHDGKVSDSGWPDCDRARLGHLMLGAGS